LIPEQTKTKIFDRRTVWTRPTSLQGRLTGPTRGWNDTAPTNIGVLHKKLPEFPKVLADLDVRRHARGIALDEKQKILRIEAEEPALIPMKSTTMEISSMAITAGLLQVGKQVDLDKTVRSDRHTKTMASEPPTRLIVGVLQPTAKETMKSFDTGLHCRQTLQVMTIAITCEKLKSHRSKDGLTSTIVGTDKEMFGCNNKGFHGEKRRQVNNDLRVKIDKRHHNSIETEFMNDGLDE